MLMNWFRRTLKWFSDPEQDGQGAIRRPSGLPHFGRVFVVFLMIGASAFSQGRPQRSRGTRPGANPNDKNASMVMPNFNGVLKGIDKKFILLETEDGNEQKLNLTKKTKYFEGEKTIGWGDLKVGDKIAAEVMMAPDRSFDGVNIRVDRKNKPSVD